MFNKFALDGTIRNDSVFKSAERDFFGIFIPELFIHRKNSKVNSGTILPIASKKKLLLKSWGNIISDLSMPMQPN